MLRQEEDCRSSWQQQTVLSEKYPTSGLKAAGLYLPLSDCFCHRLGDADNESVCEQWQLVLCFWSTDCNPDDMAEFSGTWLSASLSQHSHYTLLSFSVKNQQYMPHTWLFVTSEEFTSPSLAALSFIASLKTGSLPPSLPWADRCLLSCSSFRLI